MNGIKFEWAIESQHLLLLENLPLKLSFWDTTYIKSS